MPKHFVRGTRRKIRAGGFTAAIRGYLGFGTNSSVKNQRISMIFYTNSLFSPSESEAEPDQHKADQCKPCHNGPVKTEQLLYAQAGTDSVRQRHA